MLSFKRCMHMTRIQFIIHFKKLFISSHIHIRKHTHIECLENNAMMNFCGGIEWTSKLVFHVKILSAFICLCVYGWMWWQWYFIRLYLPVNMAPLGFIGIFSSQCDATFFFFLVRSQMFVSLCWWKVLILMLFHPRCRLFVKDTAKLFFFSHWWKGK